jgi:hypothetical protein
MDILPVIEFGGSGVAAWEAVKILQCADRVVPSKFSDHFRGEKT